MIGEGELAEPEAQGHFDLEVVGSDHPGIVRDVFKALAAAGVNVEELSTKTTNAPESGRLLFEARARLASGPDVKRDADSGKPRSDRARSDGGYSLVGLGVCCEGILGALIERDVC